MATVILGIAAAMLLALGIVRRRRALLSRKEQYMSASGLRSVRAHISIVLLGATLIAASLESARDGIACPSVPTNRHVTTSDARLPGIFMAEVWQ